VEGTRILDLLFPERCAACGCGETLFCARCCARLEVIRPPLCARCGAPTAWPVERCAECAGRRLAFATARAAVAYEGPARALVAAWKERGLRSLARRAGALVEVHVARPNPDALAFVPGDRERMLWRGANTAEALARELARRWEVPIIGALRRVGRERPQRGLSRTERRANVRAAFVAVGDVPRKLVLVDDVYTTGATVAAAASALRRAGARTVDVVTFARAVRTAA
jgi:ComF family protein